MILGKKYDPEQEDAYREIVEMENKCKNIEKKIDEVGIEVIFLLPLRITHSIISYSRSMASARAI